MLYFDPLRPEVIAETIKKLWKNNELRSDLIAKGCKRSLLFSARAMAEKHLMAFRSAKASFSVSRYYYHALAYNPLYKLKMKYKKIKRTI